MFLVNIEESRSHFSGAHLCSFCLVYGCSSFSISCSLSTWFITVQSSSNVTKITVGLLPECVLLKGFICINCSISQIPGFKNSGCLKRNRQWNFLQTHEWTFYLNNEGVWRNHISSIRFNTSGSFQWSVNSMFLCSLSYSYTRWGVKWLFICTDVDVSLEVLKVECILK